MSKLSHHYYLLATKVGFLEPESQQPGALELNVLMRTPTRNFTARDIGKAQQVAQMQFFEKIGIPTLEVKDVFIISVSYLGMMTEKQFQAVPEGMVQQERQPLAASPFVV